MPLDAARETNDREAAVMFGPAERVFAVEERDLPGPGGAFRIEQVARTTVGARSPARAGLQQRSRQTVVLGGTHWHSANLHRHF
jgi:hypothetical protein